MIQLQRGKMINKQNKKSIQIINIGGTGIRNCFIFTTQLNQLKSFDGSTGSEVVIWTAFKFSDPGSNLGKDVYILLIMRLNKPGFTTFIQIVLHDCYMNYEYEGLQ